MFPRALAKIQRETKGGGVTVLLMGSIWCSIPIGPLPEDGTTTTILVQPPMGTTTRLSATSTPVVLLGPVGSITPTGLSNSKSHPRTLETGSHPPEPLAAGSRALECPPNIIDEQGSAEEDVTPRTISSPDKAIMPTPPSLADNLQLFQELANNGRCSPNTTGRIQGHSSSTP